MASAEDVGAKKQTFYEIECVIDDCDNDVGYKPLSDSDELDDSAAEEEPREEDIDSSEEWEPLMRPKLKRPASSSPSSSLPRRRGRPRKNAPPVPKATSEPAIKRGRGRPRKDKSNLIAKPTLYPTIIPKPLPFATLMPNTSVHNLKFGPNSTSTITLGPNFSPITLSSPTSSINLNNSTPILLPNPTSAFKLSPNSTSAPVATLICTTTSTKILLDGDTSKTMGEKKESMDATGVSPASKDENPEHSESPNAKRQQLSLSFPPSTNAQPLKHAPAPVACSDQELSPELSFQPSPTTMDDQLTSIFSSDSKLQAGSDINSDLDGDTEDSEELWEDDFDSGEDWNPLLASPASLKSPAMNQSPRGGNSPTPTSPRGKLSTSTSKIASTSEDTTIHHTYEATHSPTSKPVSEVTPTPTFEATTITPTYEPESEVTPTSGATTVQPTSEATTVQPSSEVTPTPESTPDPTVKATLIASPVPTLPRRRGRPRKSSLVPNLNPVSEPTSTTIPCTKLTIPNPSSCLELDPISSSEAVLHPTFTEEKSKPVTTRSSRTCTLLSSWTDIFSKPEKWLDQTTKDEEPVLPEFSPMRPPGPQLKDSTYTPLKLFQLFFTRSAIKTIIRNTNRNAERRAKDGKFSWVPLTVAEFYSYVTLVVYMGLVKTTSIVDYWAKKRMYNFSFPQSIMSQARFQAISWNLYLCDLNEDEENSKKKGTREYDRLFKIKPLYRDVLSACKRHFHPDREILVDERTMASRARIGLERCKNDRSTTLGYRLFVLNDSSCGYTWNFFVYEGKTLESSGKGVGYDSVMRLLDHKLLGRGYRLYTDKLYTSPTLFMDLLKNGILACGALDHNSKIKDLGGRSERGSIRWCRQGRLLFVRWMDTREVLMCSTIHQAFRGDTVNRNTKGEDGAWKTSAIPVPSAVKDYSKYMAAADLSDSLIEYYSVLKTTKWYKTFFYHFLDIAVVNSFILHQQLAKAQKTTPLTHKVFRETLVSELARAGRGKYRDPLITPAETNTYSPSDPESSLPASPRPTKECFPEYYGTDATTGRKLCVLCKILRNRNKTPVSCSRCKVPLCFVSSRNCFKKWHAEGYHLDL